MAIQSAIELEAVTTRVVLKIDKYIAERGTWPLLEEARRTLDQVKLAARQNPKLKALREKLRTASETVGAEAPLDGALHEDVWDVEDYIDYRA